MSGFHDSVDIPLSTIVTEEPAAYTTQRTETGELVTVQPRLTRLGPLELVDQLKIKQKIRMKDICGMYCGWEAEKKYAIQGRDGDTIYWAKESSNCCNRFFFANVRSLNISIEDQTGNEVISLRRPLNCSGCCCWFCYPRCTQKLAVSMGGESVGYIRERATWCFPVYHLFDSVGSQQMKIRGPFCQYACCTDIPYHVTNVDGHEIATITKKWLGCCREAMLDADHFVIDFHRTLAVEDKAMIVASAFLIDLMYYEGDGL